MFYGISQTKKLSYKFKEKRLIGNETVKNKNKGYYTFIRILQEADEAGEREVMGISASA